MKRTVVPELTRYVTWVLFGVLVCNSGFGSPLGAQQTATASRHGANDTPSFDALLARPVTFMARHVSLRQALDSLARVSNTIVQYQVAEVEAYRTPVSIDAHAMRLGEIMERLLDGTRFRVLWDGEGGLTVAAVGATNDSTVATGGLAGRIVDSATGRGIAGATVKVTGTKISAVSGDSGRFQLRGIAVGDRVLTIKAFGYRPVERTVTVQNAQTNTVRVFLVAAPNLLTGVVTTATGVQERRSIGNDITVINADSVMRTAPISSVTDLLEGRVPGLTVQRTSGVPGAPSRIRLRGIGGGLVPGATNTSNDPIVIVDGIRVYASQSTLRDQRLAESVVRNGRSYDPTGSDRYYPPASALDQIDPNSIEKIEVFKGPSATSQWGSDAGNGVIVITTKRGTTGTTTVSTAFSGGIETMPGTYTPPGYYTFGVGGSASYTNTSVYGQCIDPVLAASVSLTPCVRLDSVIRFQALNSPALSPFGTGTKRSGSATVGGGSAVMSYSMTASASATRGYLKMPPMFEDLYQKTFGSRAPKWMRDPTGYNDQSLSTSFRVIPRPGLIVTMEPSFSASTQNQASGQSWLAEESHIYIDTANLGQRDLSPFAERSTTRTTTARGIVAADWTAVPWITPIHVTLGVDSRNQNQQDVVPAGLPFIGSTGRHTYDGNSGPFFGWLALHRGTAVTQNADISASVFSRKLVTTTIGAQVAQTNAEDFSASNDSLTVGIDEPSSLNGTTQTTFASTTAGWYVEPRINANSRLFVAPGFRFDGGSASGGVHGTRGGFAGGGLLSFFPKINLSWIAIDREGSAPFAGTLTLLRPRIAFGVAGVQPDPAWNLRLMHSNGSGPSGVHEPGVTLFSLGNTQLHPERSREIEGGFDATLWNGRMNVTATLYNKLRIDAIQQVATAASLYGGKYQQFINIGRVRNRGIELNADGQIIETGVLRWSLGASLAANRNVVTQLYGSAPYLNVGDGSRLQAGYPIGGRWARPILGYTDRNGDGRLTVTDVAVADSAVYVGVGLPKVEIPFYSDLSFWHGTFALHTQFQYKNGVTIFHSGESGLLQNLYVDTAASLAQQAIALATVQGTDFGLMQTISELRFSSLSLNFTVPRAWSTRLRIPSMTLALQGSNLALWTNYRGKDPDVNSDVTGEAIEDAGQVPQPRSWLLRVTLGN